MTTKKRMSQSEIENATKVSIKEIAEQNGISLVKTANNEYRMEDNHSFVINTKKNVYNDFGSVEKGGNAINFVQNIIGVKSFPKAVDYLNKGDFTSIDIQDTRQEPFSINQLNTSDRRDPSRDYLIKERKINEKLVDYLFENGQLVQTEYQSEKMKQYGYEAHTNLAMVWKYDDKVVGATEQGIVKNEIYKRNTWKGIKENSKTYRGFNFLIGEPKEIYFTESGIDGMSYASLEMLKNNNQLESLEDKWFVSMEGLTVGTIQEHVKLAYESLNRDNPDKDSMPTITICIDNDKAADEFYENLPFINMDKFPRHSPDLPEGESKWDWNDEQKKQVQLKKKEQMRKHQRRNEILLDK